MGSLFHGKHIAQEIHEYVKAEIQNIYSQTKVKPGLAMIKLDKEDSLKMAEVKLHTNLAQQLGIAVQEIILDPSTPEEGLIQIIKKCNANPAIQGILVLLPLPDHIEQDAVLEAISKEKELEGLQEEDLSPHFDVKQSNVLTAMHRAMGSIQVNVFESTCVFIADESTLKYNAVIQKVLDQAHALHLPIETATKETDRVWEKTRTADILAVSLQTPEWVDEKYIKEGAIVIDFNPIVVGEKYCDKRGAMVPLIKSSLHVDSLLPKARYVFPATGGIGPIALAYLMRNFLHNYRRLAGCQAELLSCH